MQDFMNILNTSTSHLTNSMTRAEAIEYLQEHVAIPIEQIEIEVDRVITWPGQASSYKMGEMTILKLRRRAEKLLGKDSLDSFGLYIGRRHIILNLI